ncbi:MAG: HAMP domain-containing histidine kinase, partial [FCB group bacterium]|nr:HAMP domain-containing histidine kinase [FCB group bacterium]
RLDEDGRFALDCLNENIKILFGMADGLTEITRFRNTKQKPVKINLNDMIAEQIELLRVAFPKTAFHVEIPDSLPKLIADRSKAERLFHNLLENAFKYAEGVAKPTVIINYTGDNETHRFSISDNGPGIPANYRRKVFEPFFRIPCEKTSTITGTGLGLTIVNEIVASWQGVVRLERSEGRGAVFSVILPFKFGE